MRAKENVMKARKLLFGGVLVLVLALTFALTIGLVPTRNQVAYASSDSEVYFNESYSYHFRYGDTTEIYFNGSGWTDNPSGAVARVDKASETVYLSKPNTTPIKTLDGDAENLTLNFEEAGTYNLDSLEFEGAGEFGGWLTLKSDIEGVVVNVNKIYCPDVTIITAGKITLNVIGASDFEYDKAIRFLI